MGMMRRHLEEVVNKTWNYSGRLVTNQDHILNAVMGLGGEAGEIVDHHKKYYFHRSKPEQEMRNELLLELGDLAYYFLKTLEVHGFTLKEVLEANRVKLTARHPECF